MISLGLQSKFVGVLPPPLFQKLAVRGYVEYRGDEDIKWQWSVRQSPCPECNKFKDKRGWLAKILRQKKEEGLTNRRRVMEYQPRVWELEYYNYLLPDCKKLTDQKTIPNSKKSCEKGSCGHNISCEGRQDLVSVEKNYELGTCTPTLKIQFKEPFCLNEVCGKMKSLKKDNFQEEEPEFLCLNYLTKSPNTNQQIKDGSDKKICNEKCDN